MYDFAHPIEDAVEKISHSICTLEFEDHRPLYDWVLINCDYDPRPRQYEFARLNIQRTIMSKRYLKKLVDEKFVDGWDDPRMPTLAGLRRRGFPPAAIREFCERIGVAKGNSEVEPGQLESCVREELNLHAERAMAVIEPLELVITNRPESFKEELIFEYTLGENESFSRSISFSNRLFIEKEDFSLDPPPKYHRLTLGGMVRLKSGYIIKCTDFEKDAQGEVVKVFAEIIEGTKSGQDSVGIKVKGVIHWVDAKTCADAQVRLYDYLLTADNPDADFSERLNSQSLIIKKAKIENYLANAEKDKSFQFMRAGYFCSDIKSVKTVFNKIVSLKDGFKA